MLFCKPEFTLKCIILSHLNSFLNAHRLSYPIFLKAKNEKINSHFSYFHVVWFGATISYARQGWMRIWKIDAKLYTHCLPFFLYLFCSCTCCTFWRAFNIVFLCNRQAILMLSFKDQNCRENMRGFNRSIHIYEKYILW